MKLHANHRTCPSSRRLICCAGAGGGMDARQAAEAAGCSERTASKWLRRYREGDAGCCDRSSRPRRSPAGSQTSGCGDRALRRLRMTAAEIAEILGLPLSTVSLWLKRIGLGKRSRLEPPEPPNRYERRHPGELVHVDIKQLGRISARRRAPRVGQPRRADTDPPRGPPARSRRLGVRARDGRRPLAPCLRRGARRSHRQLRHRLPPPCVTWFAERGVQVRAVMTDNGSGYVAHAYAHALASSGCATCGSGPQTAHQRQGRALHPDAPQRMGLRAHLRQLEPDRV